MIRTHLHLTCKIYIKKNCNGFYSLCKFYSIESVTSTHNCVSGTWLRFMGLYLPISSSHSKSCLQQRAGNLRIPFTLCLWYLTSVTSWQVPVLLGFTLFLSTSQLWLVTVGQSVWCWCKLQVYTHRVRRAAEQLHNALCTKTPSIFPPAQHSCMWRKFYTWAIGPYMR